jgi:two-component system response regulator PilR (NtrC family)
VTRFSVGAGRLLLQHPYPGNVRELENIVEHAVALCDDDMATEEHLPQYLLGEAAVRPAAAAPSLRDAFAGRVDTLGTPDSLSGNGHADEHVTPVRGFDDRSGVAAWAAGRLRARQPADCVDLERDLAEYEKAILLRALDQAGGVKKRAAELLGINYRSLRHRLQKYGLSDGTEDSPLVQ